MSGGLEGTAGSGGEQFAGAPAAPSRLFAVGLFSSGDPGMPAPEAGSEKRWSEGLRLGLLGALTVAAALRLWPLPVPFLHPEHELIPDNAMAAMVRGDWRPAIPVHGAAFLDLLRLLYTSGALVGQLAGVWADRVDVLASYLRDPWPFLLVGRVLVVLAGIATVYLVARLARLLGSPAGGVAGAALLAVSFVHVRQSLHLWYDVPAGLAVLLAVTASLRALRVRTRGALVLAGALGGLAVATKHPMAPVALPIALATRWAGAPGSRLGTAAATGAAALAVYAALNPYTVLEFGNLLAWSTTTAAAVRHGGTGSFSFPALVYLGLGVVMPVSAAAGAVLRLRAAPRETVILLAFPILYAAAVASAPRLHLRYLAPLAPFVCLFAGIALAAAARAIAPRRPGIVLAGLTLLAAAGSLAQSATFVRLLAREDTRVAAGRWITARVPPGTLVDVPSVNRYPNPVLPLSPELVNLAFPQAFPALRARGALAPDRIWPMTFQRGMMGEETAGWRPRAPVVVTARVLPRHPAILRGLDTPAAWVEQLVRAGYRPAVEFSAFAPSFAGVFDPIDADYMPVARFAGLERPGPHLTIWLRGDAGAAVR